MSICFWSTDLKQEIVIRFTSTMAIKSRSVEYYEVALPLMLRYDFDELFKAIGTRYKLEFIL